MTCTVTYSDPASCLTDISCLKTVVLFRSTPFTFYTPLLSFVVCVNVIFRKQVNSNNDWFERERSNFVDPFAPSPYLRSTATFDCSIYKSEGVVVFLNLIWSLFHFFVYSWSNFLDKDFQFDVCFIQLLSFFPLSVRFLLAPIPHLINIYLYLVSVNSSG